ncbi:endonuclease/exonuclease/phosphatase family protein [Salinarimonas sp.]|uniref:endonuclease/exonuclease/phosphatase family protein n=1 Tax=Salinarimonas sp. TaxID=2766526 RepID=UPI00391B0BD3
MEQHRSFAAPPHPTARILTWNVERKDPSSAKGRELGARILAQAADLVCLTEAHQGSAAALGYEEISAEGVHWSPQKPSERKVVLGAKSPWTDINEYGNEGLQSGAFVAGTTELPLGVVRVIGVCIPYHAASPFGQRPKARQWSEHLRFLDALHAYLAAREHRLPLVVIGDYNQFLPRIWGSKAAHEKLLEALGAARIVTGGRLAIVERPSVDHIAISGELSARAVWGIDEHDAGGKPLSDHFGVCADIAVELGAASAGGTRPRMQGPSPPTRSPPRSPGFPNREARTAMAFRNTPRLEAEAASREMAVM